MEKGESDEVREESPKRYLTSYQDVGKVPNFTNKHTHTHTLTHT